MGRFDWAARLLALGKPRRTNDAYSERLAEETRVYQNVANVHDLPDIFHYWSNKHLRPMLEEYGFSNPDQFFAKFLQESANASGEADPVFISIGAGNCDTEVRVAKLMKDAGLTRFTIECLEMNPHMIERGHELAKAEGLSEHVRFVRADFNRWKADKRYIGIIANQSLHHVTNLEGLFDEIKRVLHPDGYFITSDIIGRNGHQRWPEALDAVQRFWKELPDAYRYNQQLKRHEAVYENWDCAKKSFEGIRAQDILPLLLERFDFHLFVGFANVVDIFVDRSFGHNFKHDQEWDRAFIDRLHEFDEKGFQDGSLTPTHMMAVMTNRPASEHFYARGISPRQSVRPLR